MQNPEFYFENQGIVFAYDTVGEMIGVIVTLEDQHFTKDELMDSFDIAPHYLVAADLSEWMVGADQETSEGRITYLVEQASVGLTDHLNIKYLIPRNVH